MASAVLAPSLLGDTKMDLKDHHLLLLRAAELADDAYSAALKAHSQDRWRTPHEDESPAVKAARLSKYAADEAAHESWERIRAAAKRGRRDHETS